METSASELESALATFGLESFRTGQREVIESIVAGDDCMCVMPTGGGKSLCYQLPSVVRPGLTIVVSPLIALMKDQVDGLSRRGIPAALINSTLSQREQNERLHAVASGKYRLVYVAPERLRNNRFLEAIRATPIQLLAVDEAHCISQWGHDFRPDYARIGRFRELLGGVQTVALTATATPRVRDDIVNVLQMREAKRFMSGFARPNLHFGVLTLSTDREKEGELEQFLRREQGAGIIYSATRKRCEALVELISKKLKIPVGAYHAGLMPDQRRAIQERFMKNELRVIVATNAFGMGIDKSDLRFVIHYNMPGSLEAYYQEAGRAGRDGKQSQCVMLHSMQDRHIQEFFIDNNYPERALIQRVYEFLLERDEDPIELTLEQIRDELGVSVSPEAIGSCLQIISRTRVLDRLEMGSGSAILKIESDLPTLVDLLPREAKVQRSVVRLIERAVGDRRGEDVFVHPRWLLQESGLQRDALARALRGITKLEEIDYVPPFRGRAVHFRRRDVAFDDLGIDFDKLRELKDAEYDRLNQVVRYAQSPRCRQATILTYFGDDSADDCRRCDRCAHSPGWPKGMPESGAGEVGRDTDVEEQAAGPSASAMGDPLVSLLEQIVDAIGRVHGRLGKHLLSQYLCGSKNAKVQKLNLHRLSGFGMLEGLRQSDGVNLLDAMLAAGVLRQQEVNRHRPTVSVAPEMMDIDARRQIIEHIQIPTTLQTKLSRFARPASRDSRSATHSQPGTRSRLEQRDSQAETKTAQRESVPERPAPPAPTEPPSAASLEGPHLDGSLLNDSLVNDSVKDSTAPMNSGSGQEEMVAVSANLKPPPPSLQDVPDWKWTLLLFSKDFNWQQIMRIRRMKDDELAANLCLALRQGGELDRRWITPPADTERTAGQQRVWREMRRRTSAGVH